MISYVHGLQCCYLQLTQTHTHTHPFNGPFSGTTQVSRYQKGKTNLDFTEARESEWQWHQLGHMQVCTLLQTDNHASTPSLSFLQAGCPSCRPTNSVKALKASLLSLITTMTILWYSLQCHCHNADVILAKPFQAHISFIGQHKAPSVQLVNTAPWLCDILQFNNNNNHLPLYKC